MMYNLSVVDYLSSQIYVDICLQHYYWCQSQYFFAAIYHYHRPPICEPQSQRTFEMNISFCLKVTPLSKKWDNSRRNSGNNTGEVSFEKKRFQPEGSVTFYWIYIRLTYLCSLELTHYCMTLSKCSKNQVAIFKIFANHNIYDKVSNVFTGFKVTASY